MARITKADLAAQVAALQEQIAALSKENAALREAVAMGEQRINKGHALVRALKAEHNEVVERVYMLERMVLDQARAPQPVAQPVSDIDRVNDMARACARRAPARTSRPVVTRFVRSGQIWEKTRVGNRATEVCLGHIVH